PRTAAPSGTARTRRRPTRGHRTHTPRRLRLPRARGRRPGAGRARSTVRRPRRALGPAPPRRAGPARKRRAHDAARRRGARRPPALRRRPARTRAPPRTDVRWTHAARALQHESRAGTPARCDFAHAHRPRRLAWHLPRGQTRAPHVYHRTHRPLVPRGTDRTRGPVPHATPALRHTVRPRRPRAHTRAIVEPRRRHRARWPPVPLPSRRALPPRPRASRTSPLRFAL